MAVSADDSLLLSTSQSGAKIWNPRTGACLRSVEGSGYGLCCAFVPGNRHALVGTKAGTLEFVDVAAASITRAVAAHAAPLWSIALQPDGEGFVTGGADKEVSPPLRRPRLHPCPAPCSAAGPSTRSLNPRLRLSLLNRTQVKFWEYTLAPPDDAEPGAPRAEAPQASRPPSRAALRLDF